MPTTNHGLHHASQRAKNLIEHSSHYTFEIDPNPCPEYTSPLPSDEIKAVRHVDPKSQPRLYAVGHCRRKRYAALDEHALHCPESEAESAPVLARYLTQVARNTEEKVRALHRWICANIEGKESSQRGDTSAEAVLQSRTATGQGYANLMKALCKEAEVECKVVHGVCKGPGWGAIQDNEHMPENNHAWNAVSLSELGGWVLLDCSWAAGYFDDAQEFQFCYEDVYFLTRPELFIIDHVPSDYRLALLERPVTWSQFRTSMGSLRHGWAPVTCPQSELYCASSTIEPTTFALEFVNFKGYPMEMLDCTLTCLSQPYIQMPPVLSTSGQRTILVATLPCVSTLDSGETCTFSLQATMKVVQGPEEQAIRSHPDQCPTDQVTYTLQTRVTQMDQRDPLWPGPALPSPDIQAALAAHEAKARRKHTPSEGPRPPAATVGGVSGKAPACKKHGAHSLPPGALTAAAAAKSRSKRQSGGLFACLGLGAK